MTNGHEKPVFFRAKDRRRSQNGTRTISASCPLRQAPKFPFAFQLLVVWWGATCIPSSPVTLLGRKTD